MNVVQHVLFQLDILLPLFTRLTIYVLTRLTYVAPQLTLPGEARLALDSITRQPNAISEIPENS